MKHHVSGYLAKTRISAAELQARQKATEMRLHKVEKESEAIMKKLEKQLDKDIRCVTRAFVGTKAALHHKVCKTRRLVSVKAALYHVINSFDSYTCGGCFCVWVGGVGQTPWSL